MEKTFVEWTGGTRTVGPWREIAIKNGDIRELVSNDGKRAWLSGKNRTGLFGSVSVNDFRIIENMEKFLRARKKKI